MGLAYEPRGEEEDLLTLKVVDALVTGQQVNTVGLIHIALHEVVFCRGAHVPILTSPPSCFCQGKHLETDCPDNFFLLLSGPNEEFGIQLANRPFLALRGQCHIYGKGLDFRTYKNSVTQ